MWGLHSSSPHPNTPASPRHSPPSPYSIPTSSSSRHSKFSFPLRRDLLPPPPPPRRRLTLAFHGDRDDPPPPSPPFLFPRLHFRTLQPCVGPSSSPLPSASTYYSLPPILLYPAKTFGAGDIGETTCNGLASFQTGHSHTWRDSPPSAHMHLATTFPLFHFFPPNFFGNVGKALSNRTVKTSDLQQALLDSLSLSLSGPGEQASTRPIFPACSSKSICLPAACYSYSHFST